MDYNTACPWAKKELLKEVSFYTTHLRIRELREGACALSKKLESHVKVVRMYGFKLEGGGGNGLKRVFANFLR